MIESLAIMWSSAAAPQLTPAHKTSSRLPFAQLALQAGLSRVTTIKCIQVGVYLEAIDGQDIHLAPAGTDASRQEVLELGPQQGDLQASCHACFACPLLTVTDLLQGKASCCSRPAGSPKQPLSYLCMVLCECAGTKHCR